MASASGSNAVENSSVPSDSVVSYKAIGITSLLKDRPTLDQLLILMRADVMFKHSVGRYYGGLLSESQVSMLVEGLKS